MTDRPQAVSIDTTTDEGTMLTNTNNVADFAGTDVLVVDDEPMVRDFVAKVLRRNGFTCRTASDAGEAVAAVMDCPPALVITDMRMPGKDGSWLQGELGKRWPEMPVIMLTAVSEAKQAVKCLHAGARDYLVKPIDIDELLISVRRALERAQPIERAQRQQRELEDTVRNRTALLRGALDTSETAYQDTLGDVVNRQRTPDKSSPGRASLPASTTTGGGLLPHFDREALGSDEAIELASLRIARKLIAEGRSHVDVAAAIGENLVRRGTVLGASLWTKRSNDGGVEAVIALGAAGGPSGLVLSRRAVSSIETQSEEEEDAASVSAPIVVRGVPEGAFQLTWPGALQKHMYVLTEWLALILAASFPRENPDRG